MGASSKLPLTNTSSNSLCAPHSLFFSDSRNTAKLLTQQPWAPSLPSHHFCLWDLLYCTSKTKPGCFQMWQRRAFPVKVVCLPAFSPSCSVKISFQMCLWSWLTVFPAHDQWTGGLTDLKLYLTSPQASGVMSVPPAAAFPHSVCSVFHYLGGSPAPGALTPGGRKVLLEA